MNYLNLHTLRTLPLSNTNRDDTGAPKAVVYGSVPRSRISSQSRKRHVRVAFELDAPNEQTYRSKLVATKVAERAIAELVDTGVEVDDSTRTKIEKDLSTALGKLTSGADDKKATLLWVEEAEIAAMVAKVVSKHTDIDISASDIVGNRTRSLAIAAFGRFFAAAPQSGVEAAIQVAHSLTTHRRQVDLDYFTAVDDISASLGEHAGAGHLDVAEFTNGTFYEFCAIDTRQLNRNWADRDAEDAIDRLARLITSLVLTVPKGKQNSTAPTTVPAAVLATAADQPLSYAAAFERAVPESDDGMEAASVQRLFAYHDKVKSLDPALARREWTSGTGVDEPMPLTELADELAGQVLSR